MADEQANYDEMKADLTTKRRARAGDLLHDRYYRTRRQLLGFTVGWFAVAGTDVFISGALRWNPQITAVLAFGAAVTTLLLVIMPWSRVAFRASGTFAIGTILYRVASITFGARPYADALPIAIVTGIFAIMLARLYWMWWLERVGPWHAEFYRKRKHR